MTEQISSQSDLAADTADLKPINGWTLFQVWLFAGPLNPGFILVAILGGLPSGIYIVAFVFLSLSALLYLTFASDWPPSSFSKLGISWFLLFQVVCGFPALLLMSASKSVRSIVQMLVQGNLNGILFWLTASAILAAGAALTSKLILEMRANEIRSST